MKILAIERELPGATAEGFRPHLKAEARRAWELYQAGVFREMYFRADEAVAVLIPDARMAGAGVLGTLPLVRATDRLT
jgi:hypothetical protein